MTILQFTLGLPPILTAIILCVCMAVYFRWTQNKSAFSKCNSPECVRCSKYEELNRKAFGRLQTFIEKKKEDKYFCRLYEALASRKTPILKNQNPNVLYIPDLKALPWWPEAQFKSEVTLLQKNFKKILFEYKKIMKDYFISCDGWVKNDTPNGQWSVFFLYNQGIKNSYNCTKCPETVAIIESMEAFQNGTVFGNASFSVLHPNTHITEHYGPTNTRIRCHLGLVVPKLCQLIVADKVQEWEPGKCLLFDDSFLHSAKNMGEFEFDFTSCRGVLMLDFWHPDLTMKEREALKAVYFFKQ